MTENKVDVKRYYEIPVAAPMHERLLIYRMLASAGTDPGRNIATVQYGWDFVQMLEAYQHAAGLGRTREMLAIFEASLVEAADQLSDLLVTPTPEPGYDARCHNRRRPCRWGDSQ